MEKRSYSDRIIERHRVFVLLFIFFIVLGIIVYRAFYLTVIKHDEYGGYAKNQWTLNVQVDAKRGSIFDRNGITLAASANAYRVDCDIKALRAYADKNYIPISKIAMDVSTVLQLDFDDVYKKISNKNFKWAVLKRRIDKYVAASVNSLGYYDIVTGADTERYYPNNNFLAQVLGFTNDNGGAQGIELQYD
ncbi:MAG: stage V sporulation protein D, partial [Oscillospiraceae bacterium]|nr:stage V sporulation protein D [Oscillospiraceae bacterium]